MAVNEQDVRHVAALARLGIEPELLRSLAVELNGILGHMEAIGRVDVSGVPAFEGGGIGEMPLRPDGEPPVPLERSVESLAPEFRDGFFLVPRLATHGDDADGDVEGGS